MYYEVGDFIETGNIRQHYPWRCHYREKSVIGAGSVVNCSIPAKCAAVGNPCRVIRHFSIDEKRRD